MFYNKRKKGFFLNDNKGVFLMKKIEVIYPEAVQRTKEKIHDDLIHYLATKENIPTLENYLIDRKHYVDQIWINVWMNKASSQVPRIEKKQFLETKGFEVEGVDKKVITKLFRQEIKLKTSGLNCIKVQDQII